MTLIILFKKNRFISDNNTFAGQQNSWVYIKFTEKTNLLFIGIKKFVIFVIIISN